MARLKIPRRPGTFPGSRYSLARWFANSAQLSSIFRRRSHGGTAVLFIAERASLPFRPIIDPRDALDTQHTTSHSLFPLPLSLSLSLPLSFEAPLLTVLLKILSSGWKRNEKQEKRKKERKRRNSFRESFHRGPSDSVDRGAAKRQTKKRDARTTVGFTVSSQGFFARRLRLSRKSRGFIGSKAILLDTSSFALDT